MKILYIFYLTLAFFSLKTLAQDKPINDKRPRLDTWLYTVLITDHNPQLIRDFISNDSDIKSRTWLPKPTALSKYGKMNVKEIVLKENVKVFTWDEILTRFHAKAENRKLPVMIDSVKYDYPGITIIATRDAVKSVDVVTDDLSNKYLNINTGVIIRKPKNKKMVWD